LRREAYATGWRLTKWQPSPDADFEWYVQAAVSGWSVRNGGIIAAVAAGLALSACGGGAPQDASEPSGSFPVAVRIASFPASQRLSEHAHLVIAVSNAGSKTIPDIAVTVTDPTVRDPTTVEAFGADQGMQGLASRSRPVWIVDRGPGRCAYSCQSGGAGGAVTAYADTWALGALRPGASATFDWGVTAVKPGTHVVEYQIAAGLNGKAKAVLADGGKPIGRFRVTIRSAPAQQYVNNRAQIVTTR